MPQYNASHITRLRNLENDLSHKITFFLEAKLTIVFEFIVALYWQISCSQTLVECKSVSDQQRFPPFLADPQHIHHTENGSHVEPKH